MSSMLNTHRCLIPTLLLLLGVLAVGCGDDDSNPGDVSTSSNGTNNMVETGTTDMTTGDTTTAPTSNMTTAGTTDMTTGDMMTTPTSNMTTAGTTDMTTGDTTMLPPPPLRLTVTLDPALSIYRPGLRPLPIATVYDAAGDLMEEVDVVWTVEPETSASELDNGRWEILEEGDLVITGCTVEPGLEGEPVCGSRALLVDAGAPQITVTSPAPASELLAEENPVITVTGTVIDSNGELALFVNGDAVDIGANGEFSAEVRPVFGINHIELTATDGRQSTAAETALDVLWSPAYMPTPAPTEGNPNTTAFIDDGIELRLGQPFLDDREPLRIDPEAMEVTTRDLADIVELLLMELDLNSQIPNPLVDSNEIALSVTSVSVFNPLATIDVVDGGLEIFVRLNNIRATTEGFFNFEGQNLDLTGGIVASASVYSFIRVEKTGIDEELTVEVSALELAIEDTQGQFLSSEVNAVFALAENFLRDVLEDALVGTIESAFLNAVPQTVADLIGELERILSNQQFDLNIDVLPPLTLKLDGRLDRIDTEFRRDLVALLDVEVGTDQPEVLSGSRGVALSVGDMATAPPFFAASRIQLGAKLSLINGLLHTLWRAGMFEIDVSSILPDQLAFLIQSATITGRLPPVVTPSLPDQSERSLLITLGQMEFTADFGLQQDVYGLLIRTSADLTFEDNALVLDIDSDLELIIWPLSTTGTTVMFEPEALAILIRAEVWPLLEDVIGENITIPLPAFDLSVLGDVAPALSDFAPVLVEDRPITVRDGYLIFDGGLDGTVQLGNP